MRSFLLATLTVASCVPRYASKPALAFADLDYSAPDGTPWPHHTLALDNVAETYSMRRAPIITYVELNPEGTRGTLVFVHGLGSYLKFWRFQLDAFAAEGWRVIALDLPGYGKSDKPASFPYTMEAMADAVRELVQHLGIEKPVLVGHSMGGQTILSYAIRYPDEPRALVLTSPAGFERFSPREQAWFDRVYSVALIRSLPEYGIWGTVAKANFQRFRDDLGWLIEERVRLARAPDFDTYAYAQVRSVHGLAHNDFVRQSLGQVRAPALIVFGENDGLIPNPFMHGGFPRDIMQSGADAIENAELVGIDHCGHSVQLDCAVEYNQTVTGFLERLP